MSALDPNILTLLNYGVLGLLVVLLLSGVVVTKGQYQREREINDQLIMNNTKLADAADGMARAWEAQTRDVLDRFLRMFGKKTKSEVARTREVEIQTDRTDAVSARVNRILKYQEDLIRRQGH